jgi:hypothetical protein
VINLVRVTGQADVRESPPEPPGSPDSREPPNRRPAPTGEFGTLAGYGPPQPPKHLAVGGLVQVPQMRSDTLDGLVGWIPVFRFGRGSGWHPVVSLTWLRADLPPAPAVDAFGRLRLLAMTGGLGYSVTRGRWSLMPSLTAGMSFNRVTLTPGVAVPEGLRLPVAVDHSFAVLPAATFWVEVSPRISVGTSIGYLLTRPDATWMAGDRLEERRLTSDAMTAGVSMAYWLF